MIITIMIIILGAGLAYCNGANDNFKGVATLYGSGTTDFRQALIWATVTTILGSLVALALAAALLETFSAKGLLPESILTMKAFPLAILFGAAATIWLATRWGFPISTTHSMIGAIVGAGSMAAWSQLNLAILTSSFFLPLLASPFIAMVGVGILYPSLSWLRTKFGIEKESCLCVGTKVVARLPQGMSPQAAMTALRAESPSLVLGSQAKCRELYSGRWVGIQAKSAADALHYLSAGAVCFARAVNDTPKIAAMMLLGGSVSPTVGTGLAVIAMTVGGLTFSHRVAKTMALEITDLSTGQGLVANIVTSFVVISASRFGFPVSTTHVSCGSLFGIGLINQRAHWRTIFSILIAWVTTLPVAAVLAAISFGLLTNFDL